MHSKIFQISNKPIDMDDYKCPDDYYDHCDGWADYIGDAVEDEDDRHSYIEWLAKLLEGVFTLNDDYSLTYMGKGALRGFLGTWADRLRELTAGLTAENILKDQNLWNIRHTCTDTHKETSYRFDIEDWNGWAAPFEDLIDYTNSQLKKGDRIYVGAIIDYHY